jgi:hypothetical protein
MQSLLRAFISSIVMVVMLVSFADVATAKPKTSTASLTLPIAGVSATTGATFSGTVTLKRFVAQGGSVFAEGIVAGTVTAGSGGALGTALQAPVMLPVTGNWGRVTRLAPGGTGPQSMPPDLRGRIVLAQTCGVLHLELGATNIDLLGVTVTTAPVALDIAGDSAGPLGALVCSVLGLVGTVAGLVDLLNQILGTLTGLVGGVV